MNFKQDLEKIPTYPDYKLFFLVDECNYYVAVGNETMKLNEDMNDDERNVFLESVVKVRNIRKHVIDEIEKREGIKCYTDTMAPTDEYLDWYNKWNNWRESLDDEKWIIIEDKLKKGEDIKEYLPDEI